MIEDNAGAGQGGNGMTGGIVHVDGGREWRGGQQQMLLLARELERRGQRQRIVARSEAVAGAMRAAGFEVSRFSDPPRLEGGALCHAHDARALSWLLWRLGWRRRRAALVASRRVGFAPRRLTAWKYGRADRVLAVSEYVRRQLLAAGVAAERVAAVPDGIELAALPERAAARAQIRAALGLAADAPAACTLSAFTPEKNLPLLLDALARGPQTMHLLLAGEGPGREEFRRRAQALRLETRVHFRRAEADALPAAAWVAAGDLYLLPSRDEGLGSSLLVAMAYGLPVVAARRGGIPELVEPGGCGELLEPDDAGGWGRALERLAGDPRRARELGERGRARVADYSAARMAERTLEAYAAARRSKEPG